MHVVVASNVNEALAIGVRLFVDQGAQAIRHISPRNKATLEFPEPVTTVYRRPRERVLFCPQRDCNPFFHFMEGLWMLSGRNDVEWIKQFNSTFDQFSDDGKTFHGAYGYRLRQLDGDQLNEAIETLKKDPDSRRVVCTLYDRRMDRGYNGRDLPCNTTMYFKVRDGKLNMTVLCRSNDMVWGAYGANAVHFSMIMEYVAARTGYDMGTFRQVSDSFHVYTDNEPWQRLQNNPPAYEDPYRMNQHWRLPPMIADGREEEWDGYLGIFMELTRKLEFGPMFYFGRDPFFQDVARPLWNAWYQYKTNNIASAIHGLATDCVADDWAIACIQWLERRQAKRNMKHEDHRNVG